MQPDTWVVEGGCRLQGVLKPAGSKNAALPELAACLLSRSRCVLRNMPKIRDAVAMTGILESMGCAVTTEGDVVTIDSANASPDRLDQNLCRSIRASILLAAPMAARFGTVSLPPPGGDVIGKRRLDTHFLALEKLGATVDCRRNRILVTAPGGLRGAYIHLDEPSVTATENALMAACMATGETVIYNAACEPNVQDLAAMLQKMGARIQGAGTNMIRIEGTGGLLGGVDHTVCPDHIEIGSFIGLAACCRGRIDIPGVPESIVQPIMTGLGKLGVEIIFERGVVTVPEDQPLEVRPDIGGDIPTIYDGPWPGFSPDLTSTAVVTATQSGGTSLIFEKMFESRLFFTDKLAAMGARLILCDPHRVVISGPCRLHGTEVSSPDIRAGMALLTAALCAEGSTVIHNVRQIERGYENIVERLTTLGARIRVSEEE
jgi:UDP-N-acetylglucosamine 1-carboxyvinyltransferase